MRERKIAYESVNRASSSGIVVKAPSFQRLYIDSGLALTDWMVKLDLISDNEKETVTLTGENQVGLMANWLNEIVSLFQKKKFLCKRIVFNNFDGKNITATVFGERYQSTKHGHVTELKPFTASQLELSGFSDGEELSARIFLA